MATPAPARPETVPPSACCLRSTTPALYFGRPERRIGLCRDVPRAPFQGLIPQAAAAGPQPRRGACLTRPAGWQQCEKSQGSGDRVPGLLPTQNSEEPPYGEGDGWAFLVLLLCMDTTTPASPTPHIALFSTAVRGLRSSRAPFRLIGKASALSVRRRKAMKAFP